MKNLIFYIFFLFSYTVFGTTFDTSYEESPLHSAAYHGNFDLVKALVQEGANVNEVGSESGNTPLIWAINSGRARLTSFNLGTGIPKIQEPDQDQLTAYFKIVQFLVQNGADVNFKDEYGASPLSLASSEGKTAIVKVLIQQGQANVHIRDKYQQTALHVSENEDITKLLIQAGADVNAVDGWGETALHQSENEEMTKLLIQAGADAKVRDNSGLTPLHLANSTGMAKALISAGADIHVRTRQEEPFELKLELEGLMGIEDIEIYEEEFELDEEEFELDEEEFELDEEEFELDEEEFLPRRFREEAEEELAEREKEAEPVKIAVEKREDRQSEDSFEGRLLYCPRLGAAHKHGKCFCLLEMITAHLKGGRDEKQIFQFKEDSYCS